MTIHFLIQHTGAINVDNSRMPAKRIDLRLATQKKCRKARLPTTRDVMGEKLPCAR